MEIVIDDISMIKTYEGDIRSTKNLEYIVASLENCYIAK